MSRDPLEWYRLRLEGLRKGSTPKEWVDDYERLLRAVEYEAAIWAGVPRGMAAILNERPGAEG